MSMGEYLFSYHDSYKYDFSMLSYFTQKSSYHSWFLAQVPTMAEGVESENEMRLTSDEVSK